MGRSLLTRVAIMTILKYNVGVLFFSDFRQKVPGIVFDNVVFITIERYKIEVVFSIIYTISFEIIAPKAFFITKGFIIM